MELNDGYVNPMSLKNDNMEVSSYVRGYQECRNKWEWNCYYKDIYYISDLHLPEHIKKRFPYSATNDEKIGYIKAVSYTHLDVYKRQIWRPMKEG